MRKETVAGCLIPCLALLLLPACATETLFRSSFDGTPAGQPPATAQPVGTAHVFGPAGSVKVIAAPVAPSGKWVEVSRPDGPAVSGMQGKFTQAKGDGVYTFSATMFMPSQAGVATVQFEPFLNQAPDLFAFLHLDFMPDNHVRIDDDDSTSFGSFQRNQPFIVQVTLDINATASTAHVVLAGAAASGVKDYKVLSAVQGRSREFGAVRIWQGFPHTGAFDATNISVTRKKP
jgi:hypothetical protein